MGEIFWLSWFERKSLDELYAFKEEKWDTLSDNQKKDLEKAIALKEGK